MRGAPSLLRGIRMLRYYYINKEWIVSRTARQVYRMAASLSLALFLIVVVRPFTPEGLLPIVRLLLLAAVLGTAITIVAMEYFLFGFDNSSALKKVFWFGLMLVPPLGPALYCFIVYSRSDVVTANNAERVDAASA